MKRINRRHIAKKKYCHHYSLFIHILALAVVFLSGCNSDIFMDDPGVPEMDISIEGDDGEWKCAVQTEGLQRIFVDYPAQDKEYVTYWDEGGIVSADDNASRITSIGYLSPLSCYHISIDGGVIYIYSQYSAVTTAFTIRFYYEDGLTGYIHVTVRQGEPLFYLYEKRTEGLEISPEPIKVSYSQSMTNDTGHEVKFEMQPYKHPVAFFRVTPLKSWAQGLTVEDLGVPAYNGKEWKVLGKPDINLGRIYDFTPDEPYADEEISVDVPPGKKASVKYTVTYQRAKQLTTLVFVNKTANLNQEVQCESVAQYPVSYDYTVTYE